MKKCILRLMAFAYRTIIYAEKKYYMIEKESFAVIWGAYKFFDCLNERVFRYQSDH